LASSPFSFSNFPPDPIRLHLSCIFGFLKVRSPFFLGCHEIVFFLSQALLVFPTMEFSRLMPLSPANSAQNTFDRSLAYDVSCLPSSQSFSPILKLVSLHRSLLRRPSIFSPRLSFLYASARASQPDLPLADLKHIRTASSALYPWSPSCRGVVFACYHLPGTSLFSSGPLPESFPPAPAGRIFSVLNGLFFFAPVHACSSSEVNCWAIV